MDRNCIPQLRRPRHAHRGVGLCPVPLIPPLRAPRSIQSSPRTKEHEIRWRYDGIRGAH